MALSTRGEVYHRCACASTGHRAVILAAALLEVACGVACNGKDPAEPEMATAGLSPEQQANIEVATRVLEEGLIGGDVSVINELVRPDYIQHNVQASDGRQGLLDFVAVLQAQGGAAIEIHRRFADGDRVALHSTYGTGENRRVTFDVFRLENGQLAEHWDAMQTYVDAINSVNGNTMVNGATRVSDRQLTEQNRQLVTTMVQEVFVEGRFERLADYLGDPYVQHNPRTDNGLEGAQAFFNAVAAQGVEVGYTESPIVVAEGNFVLVGSAGYLQAATEEQAFTVFYDLFRVDDGKMAEHWDVIQAIDLDAIPHDNGPF
jgi:predicted SnoaL-like aldol condensation-catalyzing enzyme